MKLNTLILTLALLVASSVGNAQPDSTKIIEPAFYVYKTEAGFFSGNKTYRGQFDHFDGRIIFYKVPNEKKTRKLNLQDSCSFYRGYETGGGTKRIRLSTNPKNYTYYDFGGGVKDIFCVLGTIMVSYDKEGYAYKAAYDNYLAIIYIDNTRGLETNEIEEFLKSKPQLLEKYKQEKSESDKKAFERNRLTTEMKYLKLFIAESKK